MHQKDNLLDSVLLRLIESERQAAVNRFDRVVSDLPEDEVARRLNDPTVGRRLDLGLFTSADVERYRKRYEETMVHKNGEGTAKAADRWVRNRTRNR